MAPPEPTETKKPWNSTTEGENQKQVDREVREMVSALTRRLSDLQHVNKSGSSNHGEDENGHGASIITLAGSNTGATMRAELDDKSNPDGLSFGEDEVMSAYANSNFQAINNSIMMGGSYSSEDPGIHLDISEFVERHPHKPEQHGKKEKEKEKEKEKKGKKKDKESSKSDQHSD